MTYESLLSDLQTVFEYFMEMLQKFITSVSQYPFIMLGIFLLISFPVLLLIFDFIISLTSSGEDIATEGFRMYFWFKNGNLKKKSKEIRESFHKTKRYFRQKQLNYHLNKIDDVPLKMPVKYQHSSFSNKSNPSSSSTQRSSANLDVEYDDD